ncbi:hypothetical protein GCM10017778_43300 [Streptomyces vinaceus]|nr:hypothetical protein GCM10017778_43300 [Streptomyces vinaceus]
MPASAARSWLKSGPALGAEGDQGDGQEVERDGYGVDRTVKRPSGTDEALSGAGMRLNGTDEGSAGQASGLAGAE